MPDSPDEHKAQVLYQILSHPDVRETAFCDPGIDRERLAIRFAIRWTTDNRYIVMIPETDDAYVVLEKKTAWMGEAHISALPSMRGKRLRDWGESVKDAFRKAGIEKILAMPDIKNEPVIRYMRDMGFVYIRDFSGSRQTMSMWELDL